MATESAQDLKQIAEDTKLATSISESHPNNANLVVSPHCVPQVCHVRFRRNRVQAFESAVFETQCTTKQPTIVTTFNAAQQQIVSSSQVLIVRVQRDAPSTQPRRTASGQPQQACESAVFETQCTTKQPTIVTTFHSAQQQIVSATSSQWRSCAWGV